MTTNTPHTKAAAYRDIIERGEDVSLRKRVAAHLAKAPMTTDELTRKFPERGKNSIRPRLNELIRMDCVQRRGTRANPSGNQAYVHHLTARGERYLTGQIDPDPDPPLAAIRRNVVDAARDYVRGDIDEFTLRSVVAHHDSVKRRMDPEWSNGLDDP